MAWNYSANLRGPQGASGVPGATGASGASGVPGSAASGGVADALKADILVNFDAVGVGVNGVNATSYTWNHTTAASTYVIVVATLGGSQASAPTATFGGSTMTLLYTSSTVFVWGIANASSGTKAVVVNNIVSNLVWFNGSSASYTGISSIGTVTSATGTGTTASSGSVTAPTNGMAIVCFGANATFTAASGGSNRARGTGFGTGVIISDTTGTASFTGTIGSSVPWTAVILPANGTAGTVSVTGGNPGAVIYAKTPSTYASTFAGTAGQILSSGGTDIPVWSDRVRTSSITSSATPSITADTDNFSITALAAAITGFTVTGTPKDGQPLAVRIRDNGTARAITWGTPFMASGAVALPTTTVASKTHIVNFVFDSVKSKYVCIFADTAGYS